MEELTHRFEMLKKHHTKTLLDAIANGLVDLPVVPFLLEVTKCNDIYSSSSCSGRILLLSTDKQENKKQSDFFARYHRTVLFEEIKRDIDAFQQGYLWLKVEPFIFHFAARDYGLAKSILDFCRANGLKRAGLISCKEGRFVCEVTNTSYLSLPVKVDTKQLISDEYLKHIVEISNQKLEANFKKLEYFEKRFLETFL